MSRYMVTSALPYANGPLHLGHLAGAYLPADIYARYLRMSGNDVLFCSGTDEHGVPITITAEKQGITPMEVVDKYHRIISDDFKRFGISFDNFSRTTKPEHAKFAQEVFLDLLGKGYIESKKTKQFYCENCQRYLPDRFVNGICPKCSSDKARGDQCENCGTWIETFELIEPRCGICGSAPIVKETKHWFLQLDKFQEWLDGWLDGQTEWKSNVLKYCRSWLGDGLRERAITRDISWGVPVPLEEAKGKVLYVWFEAVLGYISSTREYLKQEGKDSEEWKKYWQNPDTRLVQFMGKDNIVFHCIIEPSLLHALGNYTLPWNVPANEYLNISGEKFSTSRGTGIGMGEYLDHFAPDPMRYALAVNAPETRDSDFSWHEYMVRNNELADILGNFINRTIKFTASKFGGLVPEAELDLSLIEKAKNSADEVASLIEKFKFKKAISTAMELAREGNRYFDAAEPWKSFKTDTEACATTVATCLNLCASLSVIFSPFIPFSAEKMQKMFGINKLEWQDAGSVLLKPGHKFNKSEILFTKLEKGFEKVMDKSEKTEEVKTEEIKSEKSAPVNFEDFLKIEFKVGKILEVNDIKKAKKLYKIEVDTGDAVRTVVAGMKPHYSKEELAGRKVVVVCNLKPAKLCGVMSNGMLLASDGESGVFLLEPGADAKPGDIVK